MDIDKSALAHLLENFGAFTTVDAEGSRASKLASHPILDALTPQDLSDWGTSAHGGFLDWPAAFSPIALVTDAPFNSFTPAGNLPSNIRGMVHILAKGGIKQFTLTPATAGRLLNQQHTVTARYLSETGVGISGVTVNFEVTDGPNFGKAGSAVTTVSGTASWSYTGNAGPGQDTIMAIATVSGQSTTPTAWAFCNWADQVVTISATDSVAAEPPTSGGSANTGTFTVNRSSSSGSLSVSIEFAGTTRQGFDYTLAGAPVSFSPGQTSRTITVTPLFDGLSEITETVIARVLPDFFSAYAPGIPSEATINIASTETAYVTLSMIDSFTDESGGNDGMLRLQRTFSGGDITVALQFTGTAAFGPDFILEDMNSDGTSTVIIPDGVSSVDLRFVPVPDTRAEAQPGETAIITVTASHNGSYTVGWPYSQTFTITEDDVVEIPSNGWKLTPLGILAGASTAIGINTVPDGSGGWRGQVTGATFNSVPGDHFGYFWDNGSAYYRFYPQGWSHSDDWSDVLAINNAGMVVGSSGYWQNSAYHQHACLWPPNQSYPILLPTLHTVLSLDNKAVDINNRDFLQQTGAIILGNQKTAQGNTHVVAWVPDFNGDYNLVSPLGDLGFGDRNSYAGGINDWADYVGKSQLTSGNNYHAFRSEGVNDLPQSLNPLDHYMGTATFIDAHASEGSDINDFSEMVGASQMPSGQYKAAYKAPFTVKNHGWYDLGVLGQGTANAGNQSLALAINNNGLIVGWSMLKVGAYMRQRAIVVSNEGDPGSQPMLDLIEHAWVWTGSQWQRADANGWTFQRAEDINGVNWIVGWGSKGGVNQAFVLSPR